MKDKYTFSFFGIGIIIIIFILSNLSYSQAQRNVLFEAFTNACCGPCATYGPILDAYVIAHPSDVVAIKYHTRGPGPDPMYYPDSAQIHYWYHDYYSVLYIPTSIIDGMLTASSPYTTQTFTDYYTTRKAVSTPLNITVTDSRVPGDSIKTVVVLNLSSNLPAGNYKLHVVELESNVHYASPPGTNGETDFRWVYRKSFPDIYGISIPVTAGTYNYTYTYKRLSFYVDTALYNVAFVQNVDTKEIMNSGSARIIATGIQGHNSAMPEKYSLKQNYPNPFNPVTNISFEIPKSGKVSLKVYNLLGNLVYTLVDGILNAGNYSYKFDGSDISSGVYFYKLESNSFTETKKMTLIK